MISTLAVNFGSFLGCLNYDGKRAAETASDEIIMGALHALCEYSIHVSQQNHSDLSLKGVNDGHQGFPSAQVLFKNRQCRSLQRPK